jgi:hypothetical protein
MERRDGVLQMTFHTDGGPLQWGLLPHGEFPQAFRDVGSDPDNKVVILTGTGDTYSGPRAAGGTGMRSTPAQWDRVYWEGKHLLMSLLDIEVPMISAINGRPGGTPRSRSCATSCWPPMTSSFRIRPTSRTGWCRATACTSSTRCCWAGIAAATSC